MMYMDPALDHLCDVDYNPCKFYCPFTLYMHLCCLHLAIIFGLAQNDRT